MRHMVVIRENQPQRVLTRRQLDLSLGLTRSEVAMMLIIGQGSVQRGQFGHIDEQMMVPRPFPLDSRRSHTHAGEAETNGHRTAHALTVHG